MVKQEIRNKMVENYLVVDKCFEDLAINKNFFPNRATFIVGIGTGDIVCNWDVNPNLLKFPPPCPEFVVFLNNFHFAKNHAIVKCGLLFDFF